MGGSKLSQLLESQSSVSDDTPIALSKNVMKFKIVEFLKSNRSKGHSAQDLEKAIRGVIVDAELSESLKTHRQIRTDENGYWYQSANSHLTDKETIVQEISRRPAAYGHTGIPLNEISDCYEGVLLDVRELISAGHVIAVDNTVVGEKSTTVLYPRGPTFGTLLEIPPSSLSSSSSMFPAQTSAHKFGGSLSGGHDSCQVSTGNDLTEDLLPGEAIFVLPVHGVTRESGGGGGGTGSSGHVCRVSSSRNGAKPLPEDSISSSQSFNRVYSVTLDGTLGSTLKSGVSKWTPHLQYTSYILFSPCPLFLSTSLVLLFFQLFLISTFFFF
jgi:hypothetical protein